MKVSIIIPAYNEEKRIGKTLEEYLRFFKKIKEKKILDFEIIVVINNTTDKTEDIVKKFSEKNKELRFLNFKQKGKGFAINKGFKDALTRDSELIGFVDADMATPPQAYYDLIENIKNYEGIIASRWLKESRVIIKQTIVRRVMSRGFNFIIRGLFLMPYKDTQCGAKLFKRKIVEILVDNINLTNWAFDINLLYLCKKNNFKIKEYKTVWEDKRESKIDLGKTPIQMFSGVVRLRLMNSFFEPLLRPVKFILRIGDRLINKKAKDD